MEQDVITAQRGDREAFVRLIKNVELSLYRVARSIVRRDEDSADAIQETILKAYSGIHALKEPAFFKTWIIRILINECNKILQKRKTVTKVNEHLLNPTCFSDYEKVDLREAVDRLDEKLRIVVVLYYYEDISLKQIAETLEISEGAIKARLHRARKILAGWLKYTQEGKVGYEPC
ncbi:RNA polymerase [Paenibacillus sambharensis]|uniref:RNA polymerase n=1 Tax=Paenibacillus sambharensis TaxID=1803190 RepID=A0A2W1LES0_9BACL|nr:sigma-70 family RNA polymerase sigma factor [Paenibacillus sambharensis]PZD97179.1 RNA polymerase [Paenibacillus sambharensis]